MEGINRLYVLGCIASVFAPIRAIAEWSSHWLSVQSSILRLVIYVPLSIPFILAMWFVTSLASITTVALFKQSKLGFAVSFLVAFMPWAVGFLTCYDHMHEFPAHYCEALILTAGFYALESASWARTRGQHVGESL